MILLEAQWSTSSTLSPHGRLATADEALKLKLAARNDLRKQLNRDVKEETCANMDESKRENGHFALMHSLKLTCRVKVQSHTNCTKLYREVVVTIFRAILETPLVIGARYTEAEAHALSLARPTKLASGGVYLVLLVSHWSSRSATL